MRIDLNSTRRALLAALASPFVLFARQKPHVWASYRPCDQQNQDNKFAVIWGGKIFVNGVEIHDVWWVDTKQQIVKSFDILGDNSGPVAQAFGRPKRDNSQFMSYFAGSPIEDVDDRICLLSITLRGEIAIYTYTDGNGNWSHTLQRYF